MQSKLSILHSNSMGLHSSSWAMHNAVRRLLLILETKTSIPVGGSTIEHPYICLSLLYSSSSSPLTITSRQEAPFSVSTRRNLFGRKNSIKCGSCLFLPQISSLSFSQPKLSIAITHFSSWPSQHTQPLGSYSSAPVLYLSTSQSKTCQLRQSFGIVIAHSAFSTNKLASTPPSPSSTTYRLINSSNTYRLCNHRRLRSLQSFNLPTLHHVCRFQQTLDKCSLIFQNTLPHRPLHSGCDSSDNKRRLLVNQARW